MRPLSLALGLITLMGLNLPVLAAEPSAEAVRLAKITSPFVTANTAAIVHIDVDRMELAKLDAMVTTAAIADDAKAEAKKGLAELVKRHEELKQTGVLEIVALGGVVLDERGRPSGEPDGVFLLRKSPTASAEKVVESMGKWMSAQSRGGVIEQPKTWVVGDWIAAAEQDPKEMAAANTIRPVAELSAMFDSALANGRGVHVALMPQAKLKNSLIEMLSAAEKDLPPFVPPAIRSTPKLGNLLLNGKYTMLALVTNPEPKVVLGSVLADEAAAKSAAGMIGALVDLLPDLPQFQDNPEAGRKLATALTPKVNGDQFSIALQTGDGSLSQVSTIAMDVLGPAVLRARQAAADTASINNLKQLALAMHNSHDAYKRFPPPTDLFEEGTPNAGKPRWSWRVSVLPFLEEGVLFKKLDRGSAWDSPANAAVLKETPVVFRHPSFPNDPPGTTRYAVPRMKDGAFEDPKGTPIFGITDGTSNTIMFVVLDKPIPWQKPGDWQVDPADPTAGLLVENGMISVAYFDGSVRKVSVANKKTLLQLLTPAEGVPVGD